MLAVIVKVTSAKSSRGSVGRIASLPNESINRRFDLPEITTAEQIEVIQQVVKVVETHSRLPAVGERPFRLVGVVEAGPKPPNNRVIARSVSRSPK